MMALKETVLAKTTLSTEEIMELTELEETMTAMTEAKESDCNSFRGSHNIRECSARIIHSHNTRAHTKYTCWATVPAAVFSAMASSVLLTCH